MTPSISRRSLLKGAATATGASALTTAIAQASTGTPGFYVNLRQDNGEVNAYTWYEPWLDEILPMFEEETGITVNRIGAYSRNDEWWARLQAGDDFDFFLPSADWAERALKADMLHPLDLELIPNTENIHPDFQELPSLTKDGQQYAQGFAREIYSLAWNTGVITEDPTSWGITWDEQYAGNMTLYDQASARVGTTALYLGQDPFDPSDWDAIREAMAEQHELVSKYWVDYQVGMEMFINEEVVLGQISDGRVRMANGLGATLAFTVPEEGALVALDTLAITTNAKNVENAHKLIDFIQRPDINALQMTIMGYDSVNQAAHESLDPEVEATFAIPEGSELHVLRDLDPQVRTQMEELWTEIQLS
ncbi:MAG TPA: extracellular solute-binding protein [Thermomicrobiales bacterium]|nr:extracellular solute-binding protein [Thermomicrobiales bacterium]